MGSWERDCWRRAASAHPPASAMRGDRHARQPDGTAADLLGYDLLVPDNSLDRSPEDFVHLLQQYQRESNLIQIN